MNDEFIINPETGEKMYRGIRPQTFTYKNVSIECDIPGWYGLNNDDVIYNQKDLKAYDKALNRVKAKADNLVLPEEIRTIRQALHLTQHEAGNILGGGKNAFQRYESGEILPSKAISNLLKVLYREPALLSVL